MDPELYKQGKHKITDLTREAKEQHFANSLEGQTLRDAIKRVKSAKTEGAVKSVTLGKTAMADKTTANKTQREPRGRHAKI